MASSSAARCASRSSSSDPAALGDVGDDAGDLDDAVVRAPAGHGTVVDPARDAVVAAQAVLDVGVAAFGQRRLERGDRGQVVGVDRGVPVLHPAVGIGAAEQAVRARALEELLDAPVRVGDRAVDVLADHVEQVHEAIVGLGEARRGLLVLGDVGDDALDQQPAALDGARACPVPDGAHAAVGALHPIGDLRRLARHQLAREAQEGGAVQRVHARRPEVARVAQIGHVGVEEPVEGRSHVPGQVAAVDGYLADVHMVVEEFEDALEMVLATAPRDAEWEFHDEL